MKKLLTFSLIAATMFAISTTTYAQGRGAMRGRDREPTIKTPALSGLLRGGVLQPPPGLELPPGASFDPDPQTGSHEP